MRLVERGERFTVTVHNRPVAHIIPISRRRRVPFHVALNLVNNDEPIPPGEPRTADMEKPTALLDQSVLDTNDPSSIRVHMIDVYETEVSAITLGELTSRALTAPEARRSSDIATLSAVESCWDPIPVDATVAREFGQLRASLRSAGRYMPDLCVLVAATALTHGLSVITRTKDYDVLKPMGLRVVHF
jgi:toxin FitB